MSVSLRDRLLGRNQNGNGNGTTEARPVIAPEDNVPHKLEKP